MDRESDSNSSSDDSSAASSDLGDEGFFIRGLRGVRNNDPDVAFLGCNGNYDVTIQTMTNMEWEDLGRDISSNTHLESLGITNGVLNDERLSSLFRGLSRSSSIADLDLDNNEFSAAGLMSLEPFLQNSTDLRGLDVRNNNIQTEGFNILLQALRGSPIESLYFYECGITSIEIENVPPNLRKLSLSRNAIQSEGFNRLLRSLHDSSIETLYCCNCDIESIDIDTDSFPKNLKTLDLSDNRINTNGCRGIAKLLQEGNVTLEELHLRDNQIDDEGVSILADALKTNTTLKRLTLDRNGISRNGRIKMLELVNDISSIKATLQSNHTLQTIHLGAVIDHDIKLHTYLATKWNKEYPVGAGREKVIETQLNSETRAELAEIQGVESQSVYGEINPLHLPEVLSLVSRAHGQEELYLALKASIADLISTMNRERCLRQRRAYHVAIVEEMDAELAKIDAVKKGLDNGNKPRENKRQRV